MGNPVNFYGKSISTRLGFDGIETSEVSGSSTSNNVSQLASAFTIKRMLVERVVSPGANNTITWTLVKNDSDTAMKVSLFSSDTFVYMDTDISVSQNDQLYTKAAYVGTITYNTSTFYNISYLIDGGGIQNFFGIAREQNLSVATKEVPLKGSWQYSNVGNDRFPLIFSTNGTIKDFFLTSSEPLFNVNSSGIDEYKIDLNLSGVGTSKLLLINDTVGVSYSSVINKAVLKNDSCTINRSGNFANPELNTNAFLNYSLTFEAATAGNYVYGITSEEPPNIGTFFSPASGVLQGFRTYERYVTTPLAGTITNLLAVVPSVVGNQGTMTITLRKNSIDTALSFSFSSNTLTGESTGSISVEAGDKISIKLVDEGTIPSGTARVHISWTFNSSITNYYPVFWSDDCSGVLQAAQDISPPINFYSRSDAQPINFYSLP